MAPPATCCNCEIERLPDDLLVHVISLTSPPDACRATAVSRAFHAAADSNTVWSSFLPRHLPRFAKNELSRTPPSTKKGLFRRLSEEPALLPGKYMRMQLDKATGAKRLTISGSALQIISYLTSPERQYFDLVGSDFHYNKRGKRFLQAAWVIRSEIRAKVHGKMLSENTTYVAYLVFRIRNVETKKVFLPFKKASVRYGVAGSESMREVCLQDYLVEMGDGWMELELGEFHNEEGDGEASISLFLTQDSPSTQMWGIELRSKQQTPTRL